MTLFALMQGFGASLKRQSRDAGIEYDIWTVDTGVRGVITSSTGCGL